MHIFIVGTLLGSRFVAHADPGRFGSMYRHERFSQKGIIIGS